MLSKEKTHLVSQKNWLAWDYFRQALNQLILGKRDRLCPLDFFLPISINWYWYWSIVSVYYYTLRLNNWFREDSATIIQVEYKPTNLDIKIQFKDTLIHRIILEWRGIIMPTKHIQMTSIVLVVGSRNNTLLLDFFTSTIFIFIFWWN